MTNDKELIEAAAKAAGFELHRHCTFVHSFGEPLAGAMVFKESGFEPWSPLTDDGDAFRLAVKLRLWGVMVRAHEDAGETIRSDAELCAATRRHIVAAAAGIAKEVW